MAEKKRAAPKPAGPPPSATALHAAALAHLARYATTEAGLVRVLDRRIDRWKRLAADIEAAGSAADVARLAARNVAAKLVAAGVIDDAAFAASRAVKLTRAGRSRRAVSAHLAARGIRGEALQAALPTTREDELAAALVQTRRRRIGPFRAAPLPDDAEARAKQGLRERGILARAGFAQDVAEAALRMAADEADEMLHQRRQP